MIGDIPIKKGVRLNIGTVINNFNPKIYPDPFDIKPERWIENTNNKSN